MFRSESKGEELPVSVFSVLAFIRSGFASLLKRGFSFPLNGFALLATTFLGFVLERLSCEKSV